MAVFTKYVGSGNATFRGQRNVYDQVDYDGVMTDYTFTQNGDGSVTVHHPDLGTDTLVDIEGFWFVGSGSWVSMDDALAQSNTAPTPTPTPTPTTPNQAFVEGTNGDDDLFGSDMNNVFFSGNGDDYINGNGGEYNQLDFEGSIYEYSFVQNSNGTISISHPEYGTDTIEDIDGFWFGGDAQWYSLADALAVSGTGQPPVTQPPVTEPPVTEPPVTEPPVTEPPVTEPPVTEPPTNDPFLEGTAGNDNLVGSNVNNTFIGLEGDDFINGNGGNYNQVDYDGNIAEYVLTQNGDGSITVTHPTFGTDTLVDIDGFWFGGDSQWYSVADALAASGTGGGGTDGGNTGGGNNGGGNTGPSGGTFVNGVLTGTNGVDALIGGAEATSFYTGMGIGDSVVGNSNNDLLIVDGDLVEWTFFNNGDGTVTMQHATWGVNTISGIENIIFSRSEQTLSVNDAIAQTAGLPAFRVDADGQINGTPFDDVMIGNGGDQTFYAGVGNDFMDGGAGFDQATFDGFIADYNIGQNADGSVTLTSALWGTDTVTNIEGLFFNGANEYINVDAFFG